MAIHAAIAIPSNKLVGSSLASSVCGAATADSVGVGVGVGVGLGTGELDGDVVGTGC